MERDASRPRSHLFLVRLWADQDADGQAAWCGKVQYLASGDARYFRDWPTLIDLLRAILPSVPSDGSPGTEPRTDSRAPVSLPEGPRGDTRQRGEPAELVVLRSDLSQIHDA